MRRKFNFTGRARILTAGDNSQFAVTLAPHKEGHSTFKVALSLADFEDYPPDTKVILEAWYRTSYIRYDLGTLGKPRIEESFALSGIEAGSVRFNVKLVSANGLILATARGVPPLIEGGDGDEGRSSLIGVQSVDMTQMWRIKVEPDSRPVLEVNKAFNLKERLRSDPLVKALVFPAMLREIAIRHIAAANEKVENEWGPEFKSFAEGLLSDGSEFPKDYDGMQQSEDHYWIERFVEAFCNRHDLLEFNAGEEV